MIKMDMWKWLVTAVALIMAVGLVYVWFAPVSDNGLANYFKNSIWGVGSFEQRSTFGGMSDIASANNGIINYRSEALWTDGSTEMKLDSTYEVEALKSIKGMPFSNRYAVAVYSVGYKHKLEAYAITGNFTGSAHFVTTATDIDSVIVMDSRTGNASFRGSVMKAAGKHPITESETLAVGKFVISQALNATDPITNDDPLAFCYKLDKDMILDPTVPDGIYISPPGMVLNSDGKLVKQAKVIS